MNKRIIFISIILFFSLTVYSQSNSEKRQIAKLEAEVESSDNKLKKIRLYTKLAEIHVDFDANKSIVYLDKIKKLPKKPKIEIPLNLSTDISRLYGEAYYKIGNKKKSFRFYKEELDVLLKTNNVKKLDIAEYNYATLLYENGKTTKAITHYEKSLKHAENNKNESLIVLCNKVLYEIYDKKKLAQHRVKALGYLQAYISAKDKQFDYDMKKKISILSIKYQGEVIKRKETEEELFVVDSTLQVVDEMLKIVELKKQNLEKDSLLKAAQIGTLELEKSEHEANLRAEKAKAQQRQQILYFVSGLGILLLLISIWLFGLYKKIRRSNKTLFEQKEEITTQRDDIEIKTIQITDSINYAQRIQEAILIPEKEIQKHFPEMFVYFRPRDIVSGDFYWFSKIEDEYIVAAIDCTGHGVPGAFLSMIGNTLLNHIVNEKLITKPGKILTMLHLGILTALQQNKGNSETEDGMDMSLCTINKRQQRFQFAGAKNNLYVMQADKLKVLKANYNSIGGKPLRAGMDIEFTSFDFMYNNETSIYMLSDGYLDQFGGDEDTKFNTPRFKKMLVENSNTPMLSQKSVFESTMTKWIGKSEQIDDMLIVGIHLGNAV